jgi:hypothetical protein
MNVRNIVRGSASVGPLLACSREREIEIDRERLEPGADTGLLIDMMSEVRLMIFAWR